MSAPLVSPKISATQRTGTPQIRLLMLCGISIMFCVLLLLAAVFILQTANWNRCRMELHGHTDSVSSLSLSPDGRYLISAGLDDKVVLWDLEKGQKKRTEKYEFWGAGFCKYSQDGKYLIVGNFEYSHPRFANVRTSVVRVKHSKKEEEHFEVYGKGYSVESISISHDSKYLAVGFGHNGVSITDLTSKGEVATLKHDQSVLAFSPDDNYLAVGGSGKHGGKVYIWKLPKWELVHAFDAPDCSSLGFSPDSKIIAAGCEDSRVRLWQFPEGKWHKVIETKQEYVRGVAFSRCGRVIAIGTRIPPQPILRSALPRGELIFWDVVKNELISVKKANPAGVSCIAISQDGKVLASGGRDGSIMIWEMPEVEKEDKKDEKREKKEEQRREGGGLF